MRTPDDLLSYIPRAYKDWRTPMPIASLHALDEGDAVVVGTLARVRERQGKFPLVSAELVDESGSITANWFGRRHLFGKLSGGERVFVTGRVARKGLLTSLNVMTHKLLREGEPYVGEIVPVYGATKDLPSRQIRTIVAKNLDALIERRRDVLPKAIVERFDFPPLAQAWRAVHAPREPESVARGRRRIVFEEFFGIALAAAIKRARREIGRAHV